MNIFGLSLLSRMLLMSIFFFLSLLIGLIQYLAGPEYVLSIFYLFPVLAAAWYINKGSGILIAFLSTLTWLCADLHGTCRVSCIFIPFINAALCLVVFLFLANIAANLKQMIARHKTIARTDFLTRIPNRLAFIEYAQIEMNKSQRLNRSMTIIYIDIDNFKTVNDTYGHQEGDKLLLKVANKIKHTIRITDIVARLGGDEFAILMWRSNPGDSNYIAQKLRKNLLLLAKTENYPVTFSIGVATYEVIPDTIEDMIKQGDKLMYMAKKSGKDCIKCQIISNR